jgi:hypothetical protein
MNEQELITAVRHSVHEVHMNVPAEQIVSRGRAIRASGRRRLAACATAVAAAGSVVLGLGLSGALGAAPNATPNAATGAIRGTGTVRETGTIRTAAFTLTRNANGTDTLTLTLSQVFDPATLQQALAQDGIPALVKIDTRCTSNPPPPSPSSLGVLSVQLPDGTPVPRTTPAGHANPIPGTAVTVINPSAMPSGTELFFGYFNSDHAIFFDLIYTNSYTCTNGQPTGTPAPAGS